MFLRGRTLLAAVGLGLSLVPVSAQAVTGFRHTGIAVPTREGATLPLVFISRAGPEGHGHDITLKFTTDSGAHWETVVKPMNDGVLNIPLDYRALGLKGGVTITKITGDWAGCGHDWGYVEETGGPLALPHPIPDKASNATLVGHFDLLKQKARPTAALATFAVATPAPKKAPLKKAATQVEATQAAPAKVATSKVPTPKTVATKTVATKTVAPKAVATKTVAPKAVATKAVAPAKSDAPVTAAQAQLNAFARIRNAGRR